MDQQLNAFLRKLTARIDKVEAMSEANRNSEQAKSVQAVIDAMPGRRLVYTMTQTQTFTTSQDSQKGAALSFSVSQDGPFIITHYPLVLWKSSLPSNATDFGRWRPVCTSHLPTQQLTTNFVDISYELSDQGTGRLLQDNPVPGGLLSSPIDLKVCPVPTIFYPNSVIAFTPTYEDILFAGSTATTQGTLAVSLIGYRIVSM